jgi:very-short-patch-repair endonuclease
LTGEGRVGVDDKMTKKIVNTARSLRKSSTDAENLLWGHLRRKQLAGLKFRRQQPVDKFVVDFVCSEKGNYYCGRIAGG